jgi:HAE1 family hydrophobic/amphiphilic exporter-1
MKPTKFALDRPVTVLMVFLAVILIGLISWQRLPLELLPSINYPQITILTTYENVAPPEIESLVTQPIEEALGSIKGVRRITSVSKEGISLVTLDFVWGTDTNLSTLDVREKLDTITGTLPNDVGNPIIVKFDPSSFPIMTLGVSGQLDMERLTRIASSDIKPKLERVSGVAMARIGGGVEREIVVAVDQGRLFAYGLPISAVVEKLKESNFNFPGGSIERGKTEIRIRTIGQFETLEDLNNVVLSKTKTDIPVFLRDVAVVQDTFKQKSSSFLINGDKSIGISIFKQADSNTVSVADDLLDEIAALQETLDSRITITIAYNQATFIKDAIVDLELAGILGGILAFSILLLFLRSIGSALIVTTAIPVSVLGVFTLMYMTGLSLNIMSLGGLALGVGLLVDNGIVILENIHRHRRIATDAYHAALLGSEEMQNPVIASTLAHIIVFLPIIFVKGLTGKFFAQLALTISFSLLISILVALLLNPMLAAKRLLANRNNRSIDSHSPAPKERFSRILSPLWQMVDTLMRLTENVYLKLLSMTMRNKKKVLFLTLCMLIFSVALLPFMGKEFIPEVDQGNFIMRVSTPMGTGLETTEVIASQLGETVLSLPEVKDVFINIGHDSVDKTEKALGDFEPNIARITVILDEDRKRSVKEVVDDLRPMILKIPDVQTEYILNQNVTQILRQKQAAVEILEISGPDLKTIEDVTQTIINKLKKIEYLKDVKSSLSGDETEVKISIDREKAAGFKLSVKDIADTLKTAMEGEQATKFHDADQEIDIVVKLREQDRENISMLKNILIHTPFNSNVSLNELADTALSSRQRDIQRRDLKRVSVISSNIMGLSFSEVIEKVKAALDDIILPPDTFISYSADQVEMNRSFQNLKFALIFSILLVYMLLASLFESFLNPFIIMFAVPLAVVGVILILFITGLHISLGVYIGSIMLGGIVVNNSIILLDYTERLRKKGMPYMEAVLQSGRVRLRPILMTALTTILGLMPLAIGFGGGSELRRPLAVTVIGGLTTSTFMTLVIIPVIYALVQELKTKKIRRS